MVPSEPHKQVMVKSVVTVEHPRGGVEITIHVENPEDAPAKSYLYYVIKEALQQHLLG